MKHSILITGSSSGIGWSLAIYLAQTGHQVFAGVRKQEDAAKLKAEDNAIIPVVIDVAKPDTIRTCLEEISKLRIKSQPFSLVNNAGIALAGPIEALKIEELRKQFEVNVFGLVDTTQVFLPLIRETKGRIFNVSSISGRMSAPFLGAYSASKFALEALSDSLRQELAPFGIPVILIEPGPIKSEIWSKGLENREVSRSYCHPDRISLYESRLQKFEKIVEAISNRSIPAIEVAYKVSSALEAATPPIRIVIAPVKSRIELHVSEWLPARLYDKLVSQVLKS